MAYDLGTAKGTIELEYDGHGAARDAEKDMDSVGDSGKDTNRSLKLLGATLRGLFTGIKLGALALAMNAAAVSAANLVTQLLGVVPQLVSILSLSSALPGIFVGVAAAIGVIKAITAGVGDTIKAAFDPKGAQKFAEGLKELAPAAQSFAKAVQSAAPALKDLQQSLQQSFFQASFLAAQVPRVTKALSVLKPTLQGLATDFGNVTRQVTNFALSSDSIKFIANSIKAVRAAFSEASTAILPVLAGLRSVGTVGIPLITRLGELVGTLGRKFGDWLTQIANSGQLQEWINTALTTLRTLGDIAQNVGVILRSIFQAAGETSGGLLGNIKEITGAFAEFLDSAQGMNALRSLFAAVGQAPAALAPVITTLFGALASALGPALAQLSKVLGPALLQVVNALAPALKPLAQGLVDILSAIAPLAGPIAQFIGMLAKLAGGILSTIAAELGPLVSLLAGGLMQVLQELAPVIEEALVQGLPLAAEAGQALLEAFRPLIPVLVQFAQVLAQSLIENMPELLDIARQMIPVISQLAAAFAGSLGQALTNLIPLIPPLIDAFIRFVGIMSTVRNATLQVLTFMLNFATVLSSLPARIGAILDNIKNFFINAFQAIQTFLGTAIANIINFFVALPGRIGAALSALPSQIVTWIKNAANAAAFAFGAMIGLLVSLAVQLPGKIGRAISSLGSTIASIARAAWNQVRTLFSSGVNNAVNLARQLPGRARSAISSLGSLLAGLARTAWNAVRTAFTSGINNAVSLARSLPGRIRSAVGNLAGLLAQAGRDAVAGFVNGLRSGVGAAADAARSLGHSVMAGIKSTLKIGSPSKVMFEFGGWSTEGFMDGLRSMDRQVTLAAEGLAKLIIAPTVKLSGNSQAAGTQAAQTVANNIGGNSLSVTQNVYALPGMSAAQVAKYSLDRLRYGLSAGVVAAVLPTPSPAGV